MIQAEYWGTLVVTEEAESLKWLGSVQNRGNLKQPGLILPASQTQWGLGHGDC